MAECEAWWAGFVAAPCRDAGFKLQKDPFFRKIQE